MSRINNLSAVNGDNMLVPVEHNEEHLAQKEMELDKEDESVFLASTEELMFGWNLEREKRKEKDNRKIVATIDHIRKLAPMSRIQAEIMVKSIKEAFQEKELIIEIREDAWKSALDKLSTYRTIYENSVSQRDEELEETRTRNSSLESKVLSFQTRIAELESESCRSRNEFGKVCEEFNLRSSDELLQALSQKMIIELKHTETLLELQELRTKNEQLRKAAREAVRKLKELELTTKMVSKEKKEVERQFKLPLDQAGQNTMVLDEQKHGLVTPITHFLSTTVCQLDEKWKTRLQLCNSGNAPIILNKGANVATGELKELNVLTEEGKVEEVLEMWIEAGASDIDDKGVLCASGSIDLKLTQLQNTEIEKVITEKTRDQNLWKQVERDKPIVAGDTRKLITEHKDVSVIRNDELGQTNLTKYAISVPLPDKKAQTVEQAFIERCGLEERRLPTKLSERKEKDLEIINFKNPKFCT
uniref:Uncharacterized protein n=1 Tax=Caenorhabditis japonica TaxID=281687 RepID=A0A8R1I036_CAEJA